MGTQAGKFIRRFFGFFMRVTVVHIVTYVVIGAISYFLLAQKYWTGPEAVPGLRDPMSDHVQHWMYPAQILRGFLHAAVLYPLRRPLMDLGRWGGLVIASLLLVFGSFAGISGLIEGLTYTTTVNLNVFFAHLPEVVLQTLAFGYWLLRWERRVETKYGKSQPAVAANPSE